MRERPPHVDDTELLAAVRRHWAPGTTSVTHLPLGFGAHHWVAADETGPRLFVTLDRLDGRHDLASLTTTYAATTALRDRGLDFVHANLAPWTVAFAGGALSATPWVDGTRPGDTAADRAATADLLTRLHAVRPPSGLRRWEPLVGADLAETLAASVAEPWRQGPYGERARAAITARLRSVETWVADYHRLAEVARAATWVATHGEPGPHNQLRTAEGLRLVDWESMLLAPAERDLRSVGLGDARLLELFALEWRLDEIEQYARLFAGPHDGGADDDIALGGLLEQLAEA